MASSKRVVAGGGNKPTGAMNKSTSTKREVSMAQKISDAQKFVGEKLNQNKVELAAKAHKVPAGKKDPMAIKAARAGVKGADTAKGKSAIRRAIQK